MNEDAKGRQAELHDDVLDLGMLARVVWKQKWIIVALTGTAMIVAAIVALLLPNIYRSSALLAPGQEDGSRNLASQYSGLASLAGISLPTEGGDKTMLGLEILKSRKFIGEFIERHELLIPLFAATRWRPESGELVIDEDIYDRESQTWVRDVEPPRNARPSAQEAYELFRERMTVTRDDDFGFVTIAIEHYSPDIARNWVDKLVADLNRTVMQRDVAQAENAIDYLEQQLEQTALAELRAVLFRLIEEQTKTIMLANVSDEYLFETVDPSVVPEKAIRPDRILIVLATGFIATLFALLIVFLVESQRGQRTG